MACGSIFLFLSLTLMAVSLSFWRLFVLFAHRRQLSTCSAPFASCLLFMQTGGWPLKSSLLFRKIKTLEGLLLLLCACVELLMWTSGCVQYSLWTSACKLSVSNCACVELLMCTSGCVQYSLWTSGVQVQCVKLCLCWIVVQSLC
jgi:hypothetical protein